MTPREHAAGFWTSLSTIQKSLAAAVALVLVGGSIAAVPFQVRANTKAIASLVSSDSTQTAQLDLFQRRMEQDSARQERILCIQEVAAGLRPEIDLQTRCAR